MDPSVAAALRSYVKLRGLKNGELLFADQSGEGYMHLASQLRRDLKAAGLVRAELHEDGENTRKLRVHDLRGTFVTLSLANGKTETWVADRTGHQSSIMINRYRRAARTAAELGMGELRPLHLAVAGLPIDAQGGPKGGPTATADEPESSSVEHNLPSIPHPTADACGRLANTSHSP
jgi:hypothetical protein